MNNFIITPDQDSPSDISPLDFKCGQSVGQPFYLLGVCGATRIEL